jgi:hypothetical protein
LSLYGVSYDELNTSFQSINPNTIFIIIGTFALCHIFPFCSYIYLAPPSLSELHQRIKKSRKPNAETLLRYDIKELRAVQYFLQIKKPNYYPASFICNRTGQEKECAEAVFRVARTGVPIIDFPAELVTDISLWVQNHGDLER